MLIMLNGLELVPFAIELGGDEEEKEEDELDEIGEAEVMFGATASTNCCCC